VKLDPLDPKLRSLIDEPSPATLTLYGADGQAITSLVWFRLAGDAFEMVVAAADPKLEHLRRDPRSLLVIFETLPPIRGIQVRAAASIVPDEGARTRLAIASRYLGPEGCPRLRRPEQTAPRVRGQGASRSGACLGPRRQAAVMAALCSDGSGPLSGPL
jgi:hypothetical protein